MTVPILAYVTAIATLVYGFATSLLWLENRKDRQLREKQFNDEMAARKTSELYHAFYEAWGYWTGHAYSSPTSKAETSQNGRIFEALIRLECQLRSNGFNKEANNLGFAIRTLEGVDDSLSEAGIALKIVTPEYRNPKPARLARVNTSSAGGTTETGAA
jgi:hypothetical protein